MVDSGLRVLMMSPPSLKSKISRTLNDVAIWSHNMIQIKFYNTTSTLYSLRIPELELGKVGSHPTEL